MPFPNTLMKARTEGRYEEDSLFRPSTLYAQLAIARLVGKEAK
jgi:hypothetical protein